MVIKYIRIIGAFSIALGVCFLSACSSQSSGPAAAASTGSAQSSQKCEIDAKRICQEARKADIVNMQTGVTEDATRQEQNAGVRTEQMNLSYQIPHGAMVEVECEINIAHHSVVYAHALRGAPLTDADITTLQASGYCVR